MALSLYKTSRFSRLYREDDPALARQGFMKATMTPMHHESVPDSGDYDTNIDLTWNSVDTSTLDGYRVSAGPYEIEIQTGVPELSQPLQGNLKFSGMRSSASFSIDLQEFCYLYEVTGAITTINNGVDYTRDPLNLEVGTMDLGPHASVPADVVGRFGRLWWQEIIDQPGDGGINFSWESNPEYFIVNTDHHPAYKIWVPINDPPLTTEADTLIGCLYEITWDGITQVRLADGSIVDPATDSFDNSLGKMEFLDAAGNIVCYVHESDLSNQHTDQVGETVHKWFWEDGGTTYMFFGQKYNDWTGGPGTTTSTLHLSQVDEPIGEFARQGAASIFYQGEYNEYRSTWARWNYPSAGEYYGYRDDYLGMMFEIEVPGGASMTDAGKNEYADLIVFPHDYRSGYGTQFNIKAISDVKTGYNAEFFIDEGSPGYDAYNLIQTSFPNDPGFKDSESSSLTAWPNNHGFGETNPMPAVDVGAQLEETTRLVRWKQGHAMRLKLQQEEGAADYTWTMLGGEVGSVTNVPSLNVFFTYPVTHKPGFKDSPGERNTRESRFYSSNMPYRLGVNDEPHISTRDNKSRSRFS